MNITFRKFTTQDKQLINEWFKTDKLGMRFLSSYVTDDFVGLIDFTFYVRPDYRGKGIGYELLTSGLSLPEVKTVRVIEGGVEKDNISSIKTLEKAGFKYLSTDGDGMLMYQR